MKKFILCDASTATLSLSLLPSTMQISGEIAAVVVVGGVSVDVMPTVDGASTPSSSSPLPSTTRINGEIATVVVVVVVVVIVVVVVGVTPNVDDASTHS